MRTHKNPQSLPTAHCSLPLTFPNVVCFCAFSLCLNLTCALVCTGVSAVSHHCSSRQCSHLCSSLSTHLNSLFISVLPNPHTRGTSLTFAHNYTRVTASVALSTTLHYTHLASPLLATEEMWMRCPDGSHTSWSTFTGMELSLSTMTNKLHFMVRRLCPLTPSLTSHTCSHSIVPAMAQR